MESSPRLSTAKPNRMVRRKVFLEIANPTFSFLSPPAPEAPIAIKALVMSSESILVSWRPPSQPNGVITQYTVYTKADNAEEPSSQKVPPNQLTHEASELDKTRRYDFWVTASTNIGEGEASKIVALAPSVRGIALSPPLPSPSCSTRQLDSLEKLFQSRQRSHRSTTNSRLPTRRT